MPSRVIREGWIESERINELDAAGERFFLRLCLRADDFGRYHANPLLLRSNLFPLHEDIRSTDIPRWLAACEKAGLVRCYHVDGKRYLEIPRFAQRMRAAVSRFPEPGVNDGHMPDTRPSNGSTPPPESEAEGESKSDLDPPPAPPVVDEAEAIYEAYPRKVGKQDALKAIRRALQKAPLWRATMLPKVQEYAAAVAKWPLGDEQFVPHPATWFNRGSYEDDPKTWERHNHGNSNSQNKRPNDRRIGATDSAVANLKATLASGVVPHFARPRTEPPAGG